MKLKQKRKRDDEGQSGRDEETVSVRDSMVDYLAKIDGCTAILRMLICASQNVDIQVQLFFKNSSLCITHPSN